MIADRRHARRALVAAALLWLAGCTNTVLPPAQVAEPARIGVLDHGRHTSLILEVPDGGMLRYAYGDWDWYALGETSALGGSRALLWPSPAALGRRRMPGPFSRASVAREVRVPIEHAVYLTVDASAVRRLLEQLDAVFQENRATRTYNRSYDLVFVRHPDPYWIMHNSNQEVGHWLERLGCRVEGPRIFSVWARARGREPPEAPAG